MSATSPQVLKKVLRSVESRGLVRRIVENKDEVRNMLLICSMHPPVHRYYCTGVIEIITH